MAAQSGCLACHKIGENGNDGPGPHLTDIGAKLAKGAIRRTLENPTAPMPSFARPAGGEEGRARRLPRRRSRARAERLGGAWAARSGTLPDDCRCGRCSTASRASMT